MDMELSRKEAMRLKDRYGNWALVTGATSGIGKELATQLSKAGFNVVITGRRQHLLEQLATELFMENKTEIIPIVGDLSQEADLKALIESVDHMPIGIAIMNAGYGTSGKFVDADIEAEANMLDLNCKALLVLTHYFAQKFSATAKGAIVLMSSMVAFQGVPNAANYAATKAYVQTLGEALAVELKDKGVEVLCAAPGPVESGFSSRADMRMGATLTPEQVGVPILKAIGRKSTVLPGFLTKLLVYNLRMTPRWGKIRIMNAVMGGFTKHQEIQLD